MNKKKKGRVDELDAVSGRVGLRCGDLGAVSVLSSLGSTEMAGRVLHWIPMRGVATNVAARASVLRMSFFFFFRICADSASIHAKSGRFGQN